MKRAAVVVGVDQAGTLPRLQAAASGAAKFADWAKKKGFTVELITDQSQRKVRIAAIKDAIEKFVDGSYKQLVVYFSGHGVLRGPDFEIWLLSGAPRNPDEAVVVSLSITHARNSGIPHVVFVSDACRSVPDSLLLNGVIGGTIFPNQQAAEERPEVDVFYATLPGDPSYEVPVKEAVRNYRALFTECLLGGLENPPAEVVERVNAPPYWVIPSWNLKKYLEKKVPLAAEAVSIRLKQNPDIRVESHNPTYLVEVPDYRPTQPAGETPSPPEPSSSAGLDLNAVLLHTEKTLRPVIGPHIKLAVHKATEGVWIKVNPIHIKKTIVNLAENARDAMPQGGNLIIQAKRVDLRKKVKTAERFCLPGKYVELSVSDTGTGIPKNIQKRIFEPRFTTKQNAKGLGLAIAHKVAQEAGGGISVNSKSGKGTTFKMYFPVVEEEFVFGGQAPGLPRISIPGQEKLPRFGDYIDYIQDLPSAPKDLSTFSLIGPAGHAFEPAKVQTDVAQLLEARGRQSFETLTGFSVVGAKVKLAMVRGVPVDPAWEEKGAQQVRINSLRPGYPGRSLLLQFEDGAGTVLSPLHGFIGTVVVDKGRVVNVSYVPSRGSYLYSEYEKNADEIKKRHAYIAAAAGQGSFRIAVEKAREGAGYIRLLKSADPTLGLYAAYAYAQAGAQDGVASVYEYMSQAPEPVLFDVALLANKIPKPDRLPQNVGPFCPMLTQGWAMLAGQKLPPALKEARSHLVPALWTTFAPDGVEILRRAIEAGELQ